MPMMRNNLNYYKLSALALLGALMILPGGCGGNVKDNVRGTLGLNREAPDEFTVITRAPLEIPANFTLPPPVPGMKRPQEKHTLNAAKEAVFGEEKRRNNNIANGNNSSIEAILLDKTGAGNSKGDIRTLINKEADEFAEKNTPVTQKLLGISGKSVKPATSIVDAKAEYERIKKTLEDGKRVYGDETPAIIDY